MSPQWMAGNMSARLYDADFPLLMPRWGYVASAFVLFLIGFFGFFLNLLVILLMFKDRQLWTPLNIILFNLVCSDFSVSVLGNPFTLISALFHGWIFGSTMCVLYGFFMALLGITSITTLTVISFERYMMVTRPLAPRTLSPRGAALAVLFIWAYSLALTVPPLVGWGNYVSEAANISCSVNWHEQSTNTLTYILFLFAMGQIVPFIIITYSYANIIYTMKKNSKRLGRVSRAETRATTMVFIMIVAFTVAWTPYSVFALMEQFATDGIISPGAGVIPALVAKSSICYNPLIYVGMNSQFRQSIKRVFGIHNKQNMAQSTRRNVNATSSPANRVTSTNDFTINLNSTEYPSLTYGKKRDKKITINDNCPEIINENDQKYNRNELSIIPENKTISDERSSETMFDEASSQSKKLSVSYENLNIEANSPILTIVDSKKITFTKNKTQKNDDDILVNIYGNAAYEEHSSDATEHVNQPDCRSQSIKGSIKQSFSLDLNRTNIETKRRKLSFEMRLDSLSPTKCAFKENVIGKIFDHSKQSQDNFKSFLCSDKDADDTL